MKAQKLIIVIAVAIVTIFLTLIFRVMDNQDPSDPEKASTANMAFTQLTLDELSKHNTKEDCWLLISGKIYDVSDFVSSHPGGAAQISANCGKDATAAYESQGGEGSHSDSARNMLVSYLLGDLIS